MDQLDIKNLHIYFQDGRKNRKTIVKDLSFSLKTGESLAIVGESGCGKTMTAMSVFSLLPDGCYAEGGIFLNGENLLNNNHIFQLRGKEIVLIPQNGTEFLDAVYTVKSQIYETLERIGLPRSVYYDSAHNLLKKAGFDDTGQVMDKYPFELSGGMAQRVILALGLAAQPKLVMADEPTRGIDREGVEGFIRLLHSVFNETILIIITHNIEIAAQCDKMLVMYDGEIMEYGESQNVINKTSHPYTIELLHSLPNTHGYLDANDSLLTRRCHSLGCGYYFRCAVAQEKCSCNHPELEWDGKTFRRCQIAGSQQSK